MGRINRLGTHKHKLELTRIFVRKIEKKIYRREKSGNLAHDKLVTYHCTQTEGLFGILGLEPLH